MSSRASRMTRRTAWLLLGGAIGLAAVLLGTSLATVVEPVVPIPMPILVAVCLLPVTLLGIVPGVRELEVESARSMLGVTSDLVAPERLRSEHRWRAMGWVVLHLAAGLLAASLLVGLVPGAIVAALDGLTGSPLTVGPVTVPESPGLARAALMTASAVVVITVSIAGTALLGWLAARWAPVFLGPTSHDRLVLAEARLAAESEHTRLARELHDGIGHALTIISVQAAAGRRTSGALSPASRPLEVIELTAQHALEELDSMLGLLRDNPAARHPEPDIRELDRLVALYRQSGMRLTADAVGLGDLTGLPSRTAYRIVAEGLNNAQRHGGGGSVEMRVDGARGHVTIDLWNPTEPLEGAARRREHGHGHGLDGIRERVRLFGGTAHAGLDSSGRWHLHASFPSGTSGTSRTSS